MRLSPRTNRIRVLEQSVDFEYQIVRRPRRKTAAIVIRPDNSVEVLAPPRMPVSLIHQFIDSKQQWVRKKLHERENRPSYTPKLFLAGEQFHLLGKPFTLVLQQEKRSVDMAGNKLLVSHPNPQPENISRQLTRWYRKQSETHFKQRCKHFAETIRVRPHSVAVKAYKSRWGSCHIDGRVYFNWRLIMAPEWIIDYVIVHELCHLIHHNHSKTYWQLVESTMPDFRNAKSWLKLHGHTLEL